MDARVIVVVDDKDIKLIAKPFLFAFLLILVAVTAVYSKTFDNPFVFDDALYITDNVELRDLSNFVVPVGTRYVALLSFALNYAIGEYSTFGYHLVNTAIHVINASLVWLIVAFIFQTAGFSGAQRTRSYMVALGAALVFAVHPIETQAVTYLTQRLASLAATFYLLAIALYLRGRLANCKYYLIGAFISASAAMMTKEISFTLPFALILIEFIFFSSTITQMGRRLWPFLLTLLIIPVSLFIGGGGEVAEEIRRLQVSELEGLSTVNYFLTELRVLVTYLRLLILPIDQHLLYSYRAYSSLFDLPVFLSFLMHASLITLAYKLYKEAKDPIVGRLVPFGIIWFYLTLSVESSFVPIQDLIFEHRLYLPSVGPIVAAMGGFYYFFERYLAGVVTIRVFTAALLILTALPLGAAAYSRNLMWDSALSLWEDNIKKSPNTPGGRNGLGFVYSELGRNREAVLQFKESIRLWNGYPKAHYNLGLAYHELGNLTLAERGYREAIRLNDRYMSAYNNLANIYSSKGEYLRAIPMYKKALSIKPKTLEARFNLALSYTKLGMNKDALREFKLLLSLDPSDSEAREYLKGLEGG